MKTAKKKPTAKKPAKKVATAKVETVLVLRTCSSNMTSYNGFVWPVTGPVSAPDWKPTSSCGHGLHGWLWGEGDGSLGNWDAEAKWLVVEVSAKDIVDLQGKVKFPCGVVVHCGDRLSSTEFVSSHGGIGKAMIGGTATAGDSGTATAGYRGTATAGDSGTVCVRWWDEANSRYRLALGYVGENGIKPKTKYCVRDGKLVEA